MDRFDIRQALAVTGQVGRDLLSVDWGRTPLGPPEQWSPHLRSMVRVVLTSRFSLWMAWGPELTFFCNEAYRDATLGQKYPWALGRPAREVWAEIWPDIGPRIERVLETGDATWDEDLLLFLGRSGYAEETYHTFSYSPISDDGSVVGMLCVVSEETKRVIGERRMSTLRDLGAELTSRRSEPEVLAGVRRHVGANPRDFPFALVYLFDQEQKLASAAVCSGTVVGAPVAPAVLDAGASAPWPAGEALQGRSVVVDLGDHPPPLPRGPWPAPPRQALVTPLRPQGEDRPYGFLVAGLNPYRPLDDDYRGFVELVSGQVAAGIASARAYDAERRRAEELAELDRAKTAFFTNVSHEFRTPLTLLLGPARDALDDDTHRLEGPQRRRMELIHSNGRRLLGLVNALLDFSKLESGRPDARYEPLDLSRYTAELAGMFQPVAEQAGLDLLIDCPPLPEPVFVDRDLWARVVLNLLSNAFKFTFSGGISVRLAAGPGRVELAVSDTGIGIAPADQGRLFERFHRVVGTRSRSFEGSGIGLALVAEVVRLHGGTVSVESEPGTGSTFSVVLPLGSSHLEAERVVTEPTPGAEIGPHAEGLVVEAMRWLQDTHEPAGGTADAVAERGGPVARRPRVLVVDDNLEMRSYIADTLAQVYEVETAEDGAAGLAKALSDPPDLVVTDVMMPELDGFGLLAALRDDPATAAVPVVMVSARAGEDGVVEGLEAGADDYLVKPFSARELLARVRTNVELDRARRAREELERSRSLLDQAQRLAKLGSWELDLSSGSVTASDNCYRTIGVEPEEIRNSGWTAALEKVHPEDRPDVDGLLLSDLAPGSQLDRILRVGGDGGSIRWVRVRAEVVAPPDGAGPVLRGSLQDVTEQREAERAVAEAAAQRLALAREHQIADELQASLLPDLVVEHDDLQVATYYQAGVEGTYVGGDWYDVVDVGHRRTALVIGDVMGRGVRAASVMGQLRSAVRAYAKLNLTPARLLELLDGVVRDLGEDQIVTCLYGVYDAATGILNYANAGHLPPLLRRGGGEVVRLTTVSGPPLGTGPMQLEDTPVLIRPGETVVFYTDGLVERRGRDLEQGLEDLADRIEKVGGDLSLQPYNVVAASLDEGPDDDIAVLMARVPEGARPGLAGADGPAYDGAKSLEVTLEHDLEAVPAGRRLAREWIGQDDPYLTGDVELVLSELLTNAVLHGEGPLVVRIRRSHDSVRVEVEDAGRALPVRLRRTADSMTGRGLSLVTAIARDWEIVANEGGGKVVWAEVARDGRPAVGAGPSNLELDAVMAAWTHDGEEPQRFAIRLGAVPTDLLIAAKSHVDNVVRELTLLRDQEVRTGVALTPEMSALVEVVTRDFADARNEIKRQAAAAAAKGEPTTDLELHLPVSAASAGERYLEALDEVDRYARGARLLTLATPPLHRLFRRWYVQALSDQLRVLGAGGDPPRPVPFSQILADEVTRLSDAGEVATRLTLLERLSNEMVGLDSVADMARIVVDCVVDVLGASSARVWLLTPAGELRPVASAGWIGRDGQLPLDSELPVARAARTGETVHLPSLTEAVRLQPALSSLLPSAGSAHLLPLSAGGRVLGALGISFLEGQASRGGEATFLETVANTLAQGLSRSGVAGV